MGLQCHTSRACSSSQMGSDGETVPVCQHSVLRSAWLGLPRGAQVACPAFLSSFLCWGMLLWPFCTVRHCALSAAAAWA